MLEQAVREDLQLPGDEHVELDDIQQVRSLELTEAQITDLTGLENFDNLTSLDLTNNKITDITPLAELGQLDSLILEDNNIEDLSPLEDLPAITDFNVRENEIRSLEPLAEWIYLENLNVRENRIEDLSPLAGLETLEDLNLRYNEITSIEPIVGLPRLRERLYVEGNPIEDGMALSPVYDAIGDIDIPRPEYELSFSEEGGVYTDPLAVHMETAGEPEGTIRYTLDGSEVDEEAPEYTGGSIDVDESATLRARFYADNGEESFEEANAYLIDEPSELPIISIATDEQNLFNDEYGIYVDGIFHDPDAENPNLTGNYMQSGQEWERPVYMQMFEPDGEIALSQEAGIRIHGGASRSLDRKSLRFYARTDYQEDNRFRHDLFGSEERDVFNRFILRNSGQDWNDTLFRDAMMQSLVEGLNVETQLYRPVKLYVNGENWGIYNIRERYDNHYFRFAHDVSENDLDLLENNAEVVEGSNLDYNSIFEYIEENGAADSEHYEVIRNHIDMENFIDYNIAQIYFDNTDWPRNNVNVWRERPNGKWRWAIFDTDFGFNLPGAIGSTSHDMLSRASDENAGWSTFLLRSLLENDDFQAKFVNRFAHYMNTLFTEERVANQINEMQAAIEPEIEEHIDHWGEPESYEAWEDEVQVLRDFGSDRVNYVRAHLLQHFDLQGLVTMTVEEVNIDEWAIAGTDASQLSEGWSGIYYTETTIPIEFDKEDNVSITSSDENVATATDNGEIILDEEGTSTVIYTDQNENPLLTLSFEVEHIPQHEDFIETGTELALESINDSTWASSNEEVIQVSEDGELSSMDAGEATVTAHNESGEVIYLHHFKVIEGSNRTIHADNNALIYEGSWEESNLDEHSQSLAYYSNQTGDSVTFTFQGTGFQWYGYKGTGQGMAEIYIDHELVDTVDSYSNDSAFQELIYEIDDLEEDIYTVEIIVSEDANEAAQNQNVHIDHFETLGE
ncbi:hypothetical protein HNR44_002370 [Geomicrobium halophilum]|uniref:GH29D-like beta-sandwich domain-containing protein n=1 Tax=Geomicrobium halophilum TaxID=549000 RepID=A0A841PNH1_9BACL|nr:CotH kinase family protein [Geomicrobium halophilum]MBB6450387.1 hypothetical protein [Geomicrobium halophilum]